jgi:hypothetical protein
VPGVLADVALQTRRYLFSVGVIDLCQIWRVWQILHTRMRIALS